MLAVGADCWEGCWLALLIYCVRCVVLAVKCVAMAWVCGESGMKLLGREGKESGLSTNNSQSIVCTVDGHIWWWYSCYVLGCFTLITILCVCPVDTLEGLRDDPVGHGAIAVPAPSGDTAYLLSRSVTGDASSQEWTTVFSHFPREFSLALLFRNSSASSGSLFSLVDGSDSLISVELERTDAGESDLIIVLPGTSVRQPISIDNREFSSIILKLEGKFLSIYVDCSLDSFLKLDSTPDNITVTANTMFSLFDVGYVVS